MDMMDDRRTGFWCSAATLVVSAFAPLAALDAATVAVSGSRQHINIVNPPGTGRCAAIPRDPPYAATVDIVPGPGIPSSTGSTDQFGAFAGTMSHCIISAPPTLVEEGIFRWEFASGDILEGTYTGAVMTTGVPDLFDATIDYLVTGGTGLFLGASGWMFETGSFLRLANPQGPGFITDWTGTFSGTLSLPAIPEPATWSMLILGFGVVGMVARRRRARAGLGVGTG
jgi:hypothetical protein